VTEAVVSRGVDPHQVLDKLLSAVGDVSDILTISQSHAPCFFVATHDTVVQVQSPHSKSRVVWMPLMPKDWAPLLNAH
jgi:hypothetical protein